MRDWHRGGVIYELDVERFKDSNGDGVGDLAGLTATLDYLNGLGVDCLWLLPIFDSPNQDNGYDVRDYYRLDPRLGNFGEFSRLLEEAASRGIRVLLDLPINHTSAEHHWFRQACSSRTSRYHDYYIWTDEPPGGEGRKVVFGGEQQGNWVYVEAVDRYYYHTFYAHQPDLDLSHPDVRAEIWNVMRFWLRQGISGFRIDAAPHMIRNKGLERFGDQRHQLIRDMRRFVESQCPSAVLLAEVDAEPEVIRDYFGSGDEFHMLLNFYLCNYLSFGLARRQGKPIADALQVLPDVHGFGQWANFLRNHDELDLERLRPEEFEQTMDAFAPEAHMRVYGRGIRRRIAPMLQDDRRRLELAFSLLLTMPGTPVLRYGDEIAMGEDLSLPYRDAVRTPMQWSSERNGGFSTAAPDRLVRPVIDDGRWGYRERNVTDQRRDPDSFLNWISRVIHMRRDCPEFGRGRLRVMDPGDDRVLMHRCDDGRHFALAVHNLSDQEITVRIDLPDEDAHHMLDLFGDCRYERWEPANRELRLRPCGYRWFRRTSFRPSN